MIESIIILLIVALIVCFYVIYKLLKDNMEMYIETRDFVATINILDPFISEYFMEREDYERLQRWEKVKMRFNLKK
jgi:hypothetical protein